MNELTIEKILIIKNALTEFDDAKLPSRLSYWLGRLEDKISPICRRFEISKDELIIKKYGIENKEKATYEVPEDKLADYKKEIAEILNQKEQIDFSINLSLFDGVNVSKNFFIALVDLIKEDNGSAS